MLGQRWILSSLSLRRPAKYGDEGIPVAGRNAATHPLSKTMGTSLHEGEQPVRGLRYRARRHVSPSEGPAGERSLRGGREQEEGERTRVVLSLERPHAPADPRTRCRNPSLSPVSAKAGSPPSLTKGATVRTVHAPRDRHERMDDGGVAGALFSSRITHHRPHRCGVLKRGYVVGRPGESPRVRELRSLVG